MAGIADFYLDTFIGIDLRFGVFIYGGIMFIVNWVLAFDFNMNWHFYMYWSAGIAPYATAVMALLINMYVCISISQLS